MKLSEKMKNSTSIPKTSTEPAPWQVRPKTQMHDVGHRLDDNVDGLFIEKHQHIPDEWLAERKHEREASSQTLEGNYMKIASLPVALVETWLAQGFDIHKESARSIVKKLKHENLDAFLTTTKQV